MSDSKYTTRYYSESRKEYVTIESLQATHLENAYKKTLKDGKAIAEDLAAELRAKGAKVEGGVVTWPSQS